MISNLRSSPIQGFITDSAGNVIRNTTISIARNDPSGSVTVDSVSSDDQGYFVSSPLPNGTYDIIESGIVTSRIIHTPDRVSIPAFKADAYNYFDSDITPFSTLVEEERLQKYKYFLQIEPESMSVDLLGSSFPIYNKLLSSLHDDDSDLYELSQFFGFSANARITIPRFDIEYYQPLTASQTAYRRIKWAGVPGIRFKSDSKLVVPLDYFSITTNNPFLISKEGDEFSTDEVEMQSSNAYTFTITGDASVADYLTIYNNVGIGDILKVVFDDTPDVTCYGIVLSKTISGSAYNIALEKWNSSRFTSGTAPVAGTDVLKIRAYHGIFQGMASLSSTVSDYFTVAENLYQQTVGTELYNYSGRYI